ncbi:MAG: hypothetical protein WDZ69_00205 [Candidatus Pacearchaeota archaeon]
MHLKRQGTPKNWPIFRKGTKYIVKPRVDIQKGVPVLIALRDILKVAQNKKEVKKAIYMKNILLNQKPVRDERSSVLLFDVITFVPSKKNYRMSLTDKGKIQLEEIDEKDAGKKISKITGRKMVKGKKIQVNLGDGRNILSDKNHKINDSVIIDLKENKISGHLPLKEGTEVLAFAGKHAGKGGKVKKIDEENNTVEIDSEGKTTKVLIKQLIVIK